VSAFDHAAVQRAAEGRALRLPRGPHRGKLGDVRASSVGSSMELHDFRTYHPGDDLRHLDWNAVARTGELVLRVRQDEVSPRVEVLLDTSASMAVSGAKAARARELAAWLCLLARAAGLDPVLVLVGREPRKLSGPQAVASVSTAVMDGRESFAVALTRAPPLLPCGLRLVVSDFLFEGQPSVLVDRLARGASGLCLVQVLDAEDVEPTGGAGSRLVDSEDGSQLERLLTPELLALYAARFHAHVGLWQAATRRVRGIFTQAVATRSVDQLAREELVALVDVAGGGVP
jgi:uncharacterized protein (DUF58 family)